MTKIPFPEEPVSEWSVCRPFTAPGLFAYRHGQAVGLLEFPDFAQGDLNAEQRRAALDRAVLRQRPLAALGIFLNVVAFEDFIRDLGARLADIDGLSKYFPKIGNLRLIPRAVDPSRPFARLDKDPVEFLDFDKVNSKYLNCLEIEPIPRPEFTRLYDLVLVRHTVAHHGALFRAVDVDRFQYYTVTPGRLINPPIAFVRDTCMYVYKIGRTFENAVRDRVLSHVLPQLDKSWWANPPQILLDMIEVFNYFGKLVTSRGPQRPISSEADREDYLKEESERVRNELIGLCIDELKKMYAGTC